MALHPVLNHRGLALVLAITLCYNITPARALSRSYAQYEHFFPAWEEILNGALSTDCTGDYANYRNRSMPAPQVGYQVIDCILRTMPEFRKSELAASTVILGLAPTALQLLSASYADTAILAIRRPVLSFLLSMSSSGVRPLSATEYDDFIAKMATETFSTNFGRPDSLRIPFAVSVFEYLATAAAIVNNAHLAYQLSVWAVCAFAPALDFLPAVWTAASVAIHLVGFIAARVRIKVEENETQPQAMDEKRSSWGWMANELTPMPWQSRLEISRNTTRTGRFLTLTTLLYVGSAVHALYGTVILSSLVFLSVRDATIVVLRLMASSLGARAVLIYELAGARTDKDGYGKVSTGSGY